MLSRGTHPPAFERRWSMAPARSHPAGRGAAAAAVLGRGGSGYGVAGSSGGGGGGGGGGGSAAEARAAGIAAATALTRGMGDLSLGGAALDDTGYEFKDNNEQQDSIDDIDAFERRLAGGATAAQAQGRAPGSTKKPIAGPASVAQARAGRAPATQASGAVGMKAGADYVGAARSKMGGARCRSSEEEEAEAEDVKNAMSDLNRFDKALGADSDED